MSRTLRSMSVLAACVAATLACTSGAMASDHASGAREPAVSIKMTDIPSPVMASDVIVLKTDLSMRDVDAVAIGDGATTDRHPMVRQALTFSDVGTQPIAGRGSGRHRVSL